MVQIRNHLLHTTIAFRYDILENVFDKNVIIILNGSSNDIISIFL